MRLRRTKRSISPTTVLRTDGSPTSSSPSSTTMLGTSENRSWTVSEFSVEPPLAWDMTCARKHSMVASAAGRFLALLVDSASLSNT